MAVAYFGIIFVGPHTHYAYMAVFLFVLGAGIAIVIAPSTDRHHGIGAAGQRRHGLGDERHHA